mmetsp:Transcript_19997/g.38759  ORF Transcript_19997/g.38759 Transcript_19997/m.38759 type:complete len:209 (-) Transcript_19997:217-843(-)
MAFRSAGGRGFISIFSERDLSCFLRSLEWLVFSDATSGMFLFSSPALPLLPANSMIGVPTSLISFMVFFILKTVLNTDLNILPTLIPTLAEEKNNDAFIALANFLACFVICCWWRKGIFMNSSNLVPTRNGIATRFIFLASKYHARMLASVLGRQRSNMNTRTWAPLHISGSISMYCRSPPRSQIEKVTFAFFNSVVRSMKFIPRVWM